jgi:hypothetical protein
MAHQNKRPLGEILGAGKRRMERKPARPLKEIFGTGKELSKERTDTAVLSPADPGFWVPSDPWIGPEQEREPGWTPNFRGKKKLAFLEQSQRMMDGWQGERAAESMPASETVETLQTGAVSVPAEKTGRRMPVERFDVRGALNPAAVRSGVLLDPERSETPAAGDMALPSGTVLRKSDRNLDEFFQEQVMPGIEPMQAAADERARKVLTEQSEARDRRWLEHFNIDPVGDYVADAVRTAATSRRERGPARIVEEVLSGIDPGKANAYIADRLADDPEFAAAADRLQRVVPAGGEVSDEEIERLQTALSPAQRKQYDKAVSEEQKRIVGEQEAFQKAADAAWKRQVQQFQQGITERLVEEMARRNMPESELDAFTRIALNASVPGMLTEWTVSNAAGGDKALHAQIMQRALEKYDPSIASRIGGEVAGLLSSGPVFAAGGALGKAGAAGLRRIAERSVIKRLMARGITEGAEGIARRLVAGSTAQRLAQAAVASGTTLGTYDAVATPLAQAAAGESPGAGDVLGAMGRGFATGALLPGIGMATGRVADAATSRLGRYAAELGGFAAENAAFVGMGTLYDGLRTGEWGSPEQLAEDFAHSVGVLGIMKSVGSLKRGRAKNPGFYDKVIAETEFTPEEVEALGRAGVDGRSYKRAVFDLLNAKETAAGREVAERAAEQLGNRYADVMRSPEVPVSAKAKLMYLVEGRIPERLPFTTDVRRIVGEDGRTTVDLLDPAGNLVQRRAFSSEKAAEAFERESAGVREVNSIQYYEALIDRVQAFDEASQAYAVERGVPIETVKNEVRKAVGGQPYDKELVRRVVELSGQAGTGTVDVPGMLAAEIGRKHGLQEGEFEQALARREEVRMPEERAAVAEYAARLKEIATQELRPEPTPEQRAERQLVEVAEQAITQAQNRDDGVVYTATMQDGRQANIIKGANLVYDPETGEVDAMQSDPTVVVRYEDGEMRQVSVREIDMIVEAVSTNDARAEALKAIREQLDTAAREEALAEAVETGGLVQLKDGRIGAVEGVNEDGSFNVAVQDAEGRIVTGRVEAGDIVGPVGEESVPEAVGSDGNTAPIVADETEAPEEAQEQAVGPEIPRQKNGQPDFNAMPADMLAVELSAAVGHDKAVERLQVARGVNAKSMDKLRKSLDGMGDLNKAMAVEQRLAAMQQEDARLSGALEQLGDMAARHAEDDAAPRDAEDLAAVEAYDQERNNSRPEPVIAERPGPDDVPFSVVGGASAAPAGVTPERWNVIVEQLRQVIGAENVVTDPEAVRAAYEQIMGHGMEIRRQQVAEANERFNTQLDLFEGGTLPSDEKLVIGRPCPVLLASGVDDSELYITQSVLRNHMVKHGLSAGDLKNLPEALEHPIMVYEWGSKAKSIVIITAIPRGNERIAVAVRLKTIKDGIKINKIASIHGKSAERLLADMNTPLTDFGAENLKWVDKEKVLDWMSMEAPLASSASDQGLVTAVKIVTNFENPKIGPENINRSIMADNKMPVEISDRLQVIDLKKNRTDLSRVDNRRFMLNPKTGTLILGDEKYGHGADLVAGSHSEEFFDSGVKENFDDFIRGWIGYTARGRYKNGIIHFAPSISAENFDNGFDAIQFLRAQDGVNERTVVRGFGTVGEETIKELFDPNIRYFRTQEGEVYGFTADGKIYLDSERMNAATPMHEYTELWSQIVARENPELWMRGVELMKHTLVWDEVNADPNYKELSEELRVSETLSRIVADEFAGKQDAITDSSVLLGKLRAWMRKFWGFLKGTFAKWTKRELDDLTPKKFAQMPLRDFVEGIDLQKVRGPKPEPQRAAGHKQMQLEIIERYNPMRDNVHTGIRNIEDIKSFEEVVNEAKSEGDTAYPDIGLDMLEEAAKTGRITVYSSYPIKQGVFVSPSQMNAADYAGGGPVYRKEVSVDDVAWITSDEGQYAKVGSNSEARFSFIGERGAENLDKAEEASVRLDNLAAARSMETAGKDALAIKMATGWERGTDGKWRYEIPDIKVIRQPEMTVNRTEEGNVWYKTKLGKLIDAPELFTAYPQLAGIEVGIQTLPKGESGSYHNNVLILNIDTYKDKKEDVKKRIGEIERSAEYKEYSNVFDAEDATEAEMNMAMKKFFTSDIGKEYYDLMWGKGSTEKAFGKSARSVLSHEIQHAIQDIEGFARGGNLTIGERIAKQRDSLTDWQRNFIEDVATYESLKDTMREDYPLSRFMRNMAADEARYGESISRDIMTMDDKELRREYNRLSQASRRVSPGEAYFNIAGEVEARNVQKRLGMSAEERLASLAEETEDVARKDQIILREALGGGAASLANAREFTERRVTTLEKLENKRDALIADRGNIANFDERLAAVDAEIEAYIQSDPVAETFGKDGAGDAHLQAVEDTVYDMQREINLPTQTVVVRNADEFIARLREMGATDEQLKGISPEHCPEGAQWRGEIVIRGDAVADKVHARVIYIHEQAHDITEALFTPDELYDAAEEMGADYMNKRLEERNASYHVDENSVESMIQGANEMISRGVDLLYRKGLLAEFFATENGPIYPVIMYMEEHGVPSRLKDLIVENLQNIKADQYGTERTRQNIPGEVERQLDSRLFPAREGDGTADETGGRTGTAGDAVPERIGAGAAGVAADAGGRIGGRGRDLERPSFSFGDSRNDAPKLTKQQQLISDLRRAVRESKAAARSVAHIVSRRVRKEVGTDLVEIMGKREFDAIVRQIEEATARQEVEKPLQRIAEVVTDLEIKRLQKVVDDFLKLKVQGEGPRGVSVAKEVDDRTRRMFEIFRNNLDRPAAEVAGELREQEDADMLYDLDAVSALEAYQEAVRYGREVDEIDREVEALRARNTQLRRERIAANKAGRKELFELLKKQILYNNELIDALEAERVETKGHRAGALKETAGLLSGQIGAGREILSEWKKQEEERRKKIVNDAFHDVDDGTKIPVLDKRPGIWTQGYRRTVEFLLSPAYSMDYLLKTISVNAPKGEGALYDHFMRGTDGYVEARGRYYIGYEDFKRALDEKARAVFGKSYPEVVADSNVPTEATITITNAAPRKPERDKQKGTDAGNPERVAAAEEYNPTIGEALYIYMTNKMTDGQVKLKRMGITEEEVDALVGILPARYVQFADWLQNEFLPERRKTYNATHLAVFGTQMARIENYVPLKIQKSYVRQEVDGSEPDPDTLPSAITGSIIRRTRNNQILNLHTNALDLMLEHGQQMEHWNAFTRVVLDMNALLTSTKFRRMLDTRNPGLHKRLKVAAQLAADSYRPQANDVNRAWIALGKLAASSKIAFRVNTALKQVLSYPAFYAYSPNPKFWAQLTKNLAPTTWAKNFRWCIDNIPSFRERWLGRMAGNEKLAQMTAPLLDKWLDKMNKYGMMPNAFVDALTCANGAKAVYDFRRTEYMERGKSAAEAERMARIDAAVSINTTQQSSEGMYIGQMQADRDFWSVSMSTFQNSNFAYLRKQLEGIDELFRDTMRERRNRTEYYKEQGFSDDEASDLALKEVVEAKLGALFNIVVFMFGLNILWGLGNNVWKYLFAPETRDEIPGELAKSAFVAAVRNTTVGSLAEGFASGYGANPSVLLSDMISFTNRLWRIVKKENPDAWNETAAYLALQTLSANGLGIDLESFVNMYQGITGMIRDGVDVEDLMWILNAPQSQAKLLAGKPKEGETEEKYHERMIFIERRIAERVDKKRRDKWTRNYTAYRQAEALGIQAERDIYGNVTVPELKQLDAEYAAALKNSGVTAAGGMRTDYDWEGLTPEQKKRWQKRARMAWKINKEEKELDAVIVYNERYAERMRELMDRKREYMVDVENNK